MYVLFVLDYLLDLLKRVRDFYWTMSAARTNNGEKRKQQAMYSTRDESVPTVSTQQELELHARIVIVFSFTVSLRPVLEEGCSDVSCMSGVALGERWWLEWWSPDTTTIAIDGEAFPLRWPGRNPEIIGASRSILTTLSWLPVNYFFLNKDAKTLDIHYCVWEQVKLKLPHSRSV